MLAAAPSESVARLTPFNMILNVSLKFEPPYSRNSSENMMKSKTSVSTLAPACFSKV